MQLASLRSPAAPWPLSTILVSPVALLVLGGGLTGLALAQGRGSAAPAAASLRPPIAFVENRGQWDPRVSFVARMGPLTVYLEERGWVLALVAPTAADAEAGRPVRDAAPPSLRGAALRMRVAGGATRPVQEPEAELSGCRNYFLGDDPQRWRTHVPGYTSVRYHEVSPGIDLRLRQSAATLEYDLLLQPGADLGAVQVVVEGAERLRLDERGALVLDTVLGPIVQPPPLAWQTDAAGRQHEVACRFVILGDGRFGFLAPGRDVELPFVVDPKLEYSTYLGGNDYEYPQDIAVDAAGQAVVVGYTLSANYPTTLGAFQPAFAGGPWDAFVTCMNGNGTGLAYSTYLGGIRHQESVNGVVIDAGGVAHLAGATWSTDFPVTPGAYDTTHNGDRDAFYASLAGNGTVLQYSTLLGSPNNDGAFAIAVDAIGVATICGQAGVGWPTTPNAYQTVFAGGTRDGFVARIDQTQPAAQQLVYSTYFGGDLDDAGWALHEDIGVVTVLGDTSSTSIPTTPGAYQPRSGGRADVFVSRLDPSLSAAQQLVWSTYLGGVSDEHPGGLAVGPQGVTVCGISQGSNFPTTPGAFSTTYNGGTGSGDGFVARLSSDGARLLWSTYLGTSANDEAIDLWVDALGSATVVGWTQSPGPFPTTPDALKRVRGLNQGFVSRFDADGSRLLYSTYLGGSHHEGAWCVVGDQAGVATVTGASTSPDFPTTPGAFNQTRNDPPYGTYDAFVTRLRTVPGGVRRYGAVTLDCAGRKPTIHALDDAVAGSATFGLASSQGAPGAPALLLVSTQPSPGVPVFGVHVYVDLAAPGLALLTSATAAGEVSLTIPIPPATSGRLYAQFVVADIAGCPLRPLSATDALEIAW